MRTHFLLQTERDADIAQRARRMIVKFGYSDVAVYVGEDAGTYWPQYCPADQLPIVEIP